VPLVYVFRGNVAHVCRLQKITHTRLLSCIILRFMHCAADASGCLAPR
jgi:hypothetical protein